MPREAKSSKRELVLKKMTKGREAVETLITSLEYAEKKLPKSKPVPVPPGTAISNEYPNWTLQQVLANFKEVALDYQQGMKNLETLFSGEGGFDL